jgi:hypothetical protein
MDGKYPRKDSMAVGRSLSPIISNINVVHFLKVAFDLEQRKPALWFPCVLTHYGLA